MDRQEAQKAYALAVSAEREQYLYQHALSKAKAVLRGMTPEEKEKYLQGQAFANALFRLKRRDKAYQALQRGELLMDFHQDEFDQLYPLIAREADAGNARRRSAISAKTWSA